MDGWSCAQDIIVDVNGVPVAGMETQSVMRSLRGLPGTSLSLLLQRNGVFESVEIIRTRAPDAATSTSESEQRVQVPGHNSFITQAADRDVTLSSQTVDPKKTAVADAMTGHDDSSNEHAQHEHTQTHQASDNRREFHGEIPQDQQEHSTEGAVRPAHVDTSQNEESTESNSAEHTHMVASRAAADTDTSPMYVESSGTRMQQTACKPSDVSADAGIKLERNVHGDLMVRDPWCPMKHYITSTTTQTMFFPLFTLSYRPTPPPMPAGAGPLTAATQVTEVCKGGAACLSGQIEEGDILTAVSICPDFMRRPSGDHILVWRNQICIDVCTYRSM